MIRDDLYIKISHELERLFNLTALDENGKLSEERRLAFRKLWIEFLSKHGLTEDEFIDEVHRRIEGEV